MYIGTMCAMKFGRQWYRAVVELRNGLMELFLWTRASETKSITLIASGCMKGRQAILN